MKATIAIVSIVSGLASLAGAFTITDCGSGEYHNFGDVGSGCHTSPWAIDNISFGSKKGCTLVAYSDSSCSGQVWTTSAQNSCHKPGFTINGLKCT